MFNTYVRSFILLVIELIVDHMIIQNRRTLFFLKGIFSIHTLTGDV